MISPIFGLYYLLEITVCHIKFTNIIYNSEEIA